MSIPVFLSFSSLLPTQKVATNEEEERTAGVKDAQRKTLGFDRDTYSHTLAFFVPVEEGSSKRRAAGRHAQFCNYFPALTNSRA